MMTDDMNEHNNPMNPFDSVTSIKAMVTIRVSKQGTLMTALKTLTQQCGNNKGLGCSFDLLLKPTSWDKF